MSRAIPLLAVVALSACGITIEGGSGGGRAREGSDEPRGEIMQVLEAQAAAWNRGDLEGFMEGYWRNDELIFTSGGRVQRGWDTTLERYRRTYGSDPGTMGRLSFDDVEVYPLGSETAWVLGRWSLEREGREQGGVFTLVFRRIDGRWLIVHDHTSVSPGE